MWTARSVQGIEVRLTDERWQHIVGEHPELSGRETLVLDVLAKPDVVVEGRAGELTAVRKLNSGRRLAIVYRLRESDGFVISAFYLKTGYYLRRKQVWP